MIFRINESGKLKKISSIFFIISAFFSLFCMRIMPMPNGIWTDFVFLPTADTQSNFYNSIFLNPASVLWSLALIFCSFLIIRCSKKSFTIIAGIILIFSAFALAIPVAKNAFDDYFMTVIIQSFSLLISSLFLLLALTRPKFKMLPCKIFIGISGALIIYSIYECLSYKYFLMVSDAIAVLLTCASLMLMTFMIEKKKKKAAEEEFDYE